jgi:hypothetical protein
MRFLLILTAIIFIIFTHSFGQPQNLPIKEISIFLEDVAFITKTQNLNFESQKAIIEGPPDAIGNAYWLGTDNSFSITGIIIRKDTVYSSAEAKDFFELLKANVGSKADVTYQIANEIEAVSGEILPIDINSNIIAIKKTNGQTVFIKKEQIQQVAIQGTVKTLYYEKSLGDVTEITIDKNISSGNINLMYYINGISWEPIYGLEIIDDSTALFTMHALIKNHYQDFENCKIKLYAGNANLNLKERIKPITNQSQVTMVNGKQATKENIRNASPPLQAYEIENVTLKKGSEAKYAIFSQKITTKSLFECVIPNFIEPRKEPYNTPLTEFPVYEAVKWTNNTKIPYAKGKIQILSKGLKSISEDEVNYTESGAPLKVNVVTSPHILLTIYEEQIEKEEKARKNLQNQYLDRFKVKGMITIKNADENKIYIEIYKKLIGRMTKTSMAEVIKTNETLYDNPLMNVSWKYEVQGKNFQTIPYEYEFFLPSAK